MAKEIIGYLSVDFCSKHNISQFSGKSIVVYKDRYSYFEKHKDEYKSESSYQQTISSLTDIISNPCFVFYNEDTNGIEFFAKIDETVLVAVRADLSATELKIRSIYPTNEGKLNNRKKKKNLSK